MGFSYDYYKRLKQPKLFLANPQKSYLGAINGTNNMKLTLNFNSLNELSFTIYEEINGVTNELYNKVTTKRLIELQYIGWFQISNVTKKNDDNFNRSYKEVTCYSLENELVNKKIYDIDGVFALCDYTSTDTSLLHIIAAESGWNVGHVDSELLSVYRTFSEDSVQIYNFLTTSASKSYECIFVFNTYEKSISAYKLANVGTLTNIVVSSKNIMKYFTEEVSADSIITKMRVVGGTDETTGNPVDIRAVNFGLNYIINLDFFMTEDWVSTSLLAAWNNYKAVLSTASTNYTTTMNTYKTKVTELTTLNTELTDLESNQEAQGNVMGTCVQSHTPNRVPVVGDIDYTTYQNSLSLYNTYTTQIATKKTEITNKEAEIASLKTTLDNISASIDESSNFTDDQIAEMKLFISQNTDYEDSTFVITSETTSLEALEIKQELMSYAVSELKRAAQPQYTINVDASNLFTLQDNKDSLVSYENWRNVFEIGNIITVKFRDDYYTQPRLMSMTIDFENLSDITLKFSNKSRLDDEFVQLAESIANSNSTSSSYDINYFGYKSASSQVTTVRNFMTGSLNATLNAIKSGENVDTLIDGYGLHLRKWLPDQNKFSDDQIWANQNVLMFTDDGWNSSVTAIGRIQNPSGTGSYWGINTNVLVGQLFLGEKLKIINDSGTYSIDENGFVGTATVGVNSYSAGFNPSTPSHIIYASINGTDVFNIDTINNRLKMVGEIDAISGVISGNLTVSGSLTGGTFYSSVLSGGSININNAFIVNSLGVLTCTGANVSGNITGSTITGSTFNRTVDNIIWTTINDSGFFQNNTGNLSFQVGYSSQNGYIKSDSNGLVLGSPSSGQSITISSSGIGLSDIYVNHINGGTPITSASTIYTSQITASDTGYGNIDFQGFDNAASVSWVQANFAPLNPSDVRLKCNIQSIDNIPDELFYSLKVKQFKYKTPIYGDAVHFGLIAQEVESAFQNYGLNPYDYDLIEVKDIRAYTDDGFYVTDVTHRIHYDNLISWLVNIVQKQHLRLSNLENIINS